MMWHERSEMKREKVDKRYVIRLTESEAEVLEKRFALSGMSSVSAYLRQQVVNGIYLEHDHEELKKKYGRRLCVWQTTSIRLHIE